MGTLRNIRLIASDLDGTLVDSQDRVSERTARVLNAAREEGIYVTFLTGRPAGNVDRVASLVEPTAPVVGMNGAQVMWYRTHEDIYENRFAPDALRDLVRVLFEEDADFVACTATEHVINANPQHPLLLHHFTAAERAADPFCGITHVSSEDDPALEGLVVMKVMLESPAPELVDRVFGRLAGDCRYQCVSSGEGLADIAPAGANKGDGLRHACEAVGVDPSECLVFGDYDNDLPAFEVAGTSVCVANGSPAARAAASYATSSNDEDGVAEFIEKYVLEV
jgi:Cof subfamily protein (haloacid dehalogenase superfamily)